MHFDAEHWQTELQPRDRIRRRRLLANGRADALRGALPRTHRFSADHLREIARRNEALVAAARTVTGKPVFADASKRRQPRPAPRQHERTSLPTSSISSATRLGFVASKKSPGKQEPPRRPRRETRKRRFTALEPAPGAASRASCLAALPPRTATVGFALRGLLRRIRNVNSAGSPRCSTSRRSPGPYELLASDHHIIGNRMRLSSSSEIVLDERWRSILTAGRASGAKEPPANRRANPEVPQANTEILGIDALKPIGLV